MSGALSWTGMKVGGHLRNLEDAGETLEDTKPNPEEDIWRTLTRPKGQIEPCNPGLRPGQRTLEKVGGHSEKPGGPLEKPGGHKPNPEDIWRTLTRPKGTDGAQCPGVLGLDRGHLRKLEGHLRNLEDAGETWDAKEAKSGGHLEDTHR